MHGNVTFLCSFSSFFTQEYLLYKNSFFLNSEKYMPESNNRGGTLGAKVDMIPARFNPVYFRVI